MRATSLFFSHVSAVLAAVLFVFSSVSIAEAESLSLQITQSAWVIDDVGPDGLEVRIRAQNQGPNTLENAFVVVNSENILRAHPQPTESGASYFWPLGDLPAGDSVDFTLVADSAEGIVLEGARLVGNLAGVRTEISGRTVSLAGA